MSFFSALFGGASPTLNKDIAQFGQIGGFASGVGQNDTSQASKFWSSLLSGNQSQISKLLAPQTKAIQEQTGQAKKTAGEFGNRGGGTNASMQTAGDRATAVINDLVSSLTSSAASNLGSLGTSLLGTSLNAYQAQEQASQQQMENWSNSILGLGLTKAAGFGLGFGLSKIPV